VFLLLVSSIGLGMSLGIVVVLLYGGPSRPSASQPEGYVEDSRLYIIAVLASRQPVSAESYTDLP
ncbi:MAG: hypothetical protein OEM91_17630, partial [Hyphomicrobiales bacterium]|nr:hypothetical protein [Hyphomicrobiales bacterium]